MPRTTVAYLSVLIAIKLLPIHSWNFSNDSVFIYLQYHLVQPTTKIIILKHSIYQYTSGTEDIINKKKSEFNIGNENSGFNRGYICTTEWCTERDIDGTDELITPGANPTGR